MVMGCGLGMGRGWLCKSISASMSPCVLSLSSLPPLLSVTQDCSQGDEYGGVFNVC